MIYDKLANYYDALVKDDEATKMWVSFVKQFIPKHAKVLELACGSGEISYQLVNEGYQLLATDISSAMLDCLKDKYPNVETSLLDMNDFTLDTTYDAVICFCDSINYLEDYHMMFKSVKNVLNNKGIFIFDMHTDDRIEEFKDMFIEEGMIGDIPYQWTIATNNREIHQHFAFYESDSILQEQHIQYVFKLDEMLEELANLGFETQVYTDFIHQGVCPGEKLFIVGRLK